MEELWCLSYHNRSNIVQIADLTSNLPLDVVTNSGMYPSVPPSLLFYISLCFFFPVSYFLYHIYINVSFDFRVLLCFKTSSCEHSWPTLIKPIASLPNYFFSSRITLALLRIKTFKTAWYYHSPSHLRLHFIPHSLPSILTSFSC